MDDALLQQARQALLAPFDAIAACQRRYARSPIRGVIESNFWDYRFDRREPSKSMTMAQ
jgi:hypothetical protein